MRNIIGVLLYLTLIFNIPLAYAEQSRIVTTIARVPVPVTVSAKNENWNTTITICNVTSNSIPLKDIELTFNYSGKINGNIWGKPWAEWHMANGGCNNQFRLLGGTQSTPPLPSDPTCKNPMTVIFSASPETPLPSGFIFKAETGVVSNTGQINVTLPAIPAAGVSDPEITVAGMGINEKRIVPWTNQWLVSNLPAGNYTVTSSAVDNGTSFFTADPVNATVTTGNTTQVGMVYKAVQSPRGKLTINLQAQPATGVPNPEITVTGLSPQQKKVVTWGTPWEVTNLIPGAYTVTSADVNNGTDFFTADPVSANVIAEGNTNANVTYKRVQTAQGNLNITLQAAPVASLPNPTLTLTGPSGTRQNVVAWGTPWLVNGLIPGAYTITATTVTNGTDSYQATPVSATVTAGVTTPVTFATYTRVQPGRPASWNNIKHVVVIVMENEKAADSLKQPFMKSLSTTWGYTSQFFALTHPSQPNYIGMVAGSLLGVSSNGNVNLNARHVGDLFDAKGLTWKAYAEDLPSTPCFKGDSGKYDRKHEPFISFTSVQNNPAQCAKIVNASQFFTDLAANRLPTFSFYVPNEDNNGHDTGVAFADRWLSRVWGPVFSNTSYTADTLFIVTYDEDDGGANNNIFTAFIGAGVKPATTSAKRYTLYSMLRTIEEIFQLGTLGQNDQTAAVINDIWQP